jgi:hypothetical protein
LNLSLNNMEKKFITYIMLICKSSNFFSKFNQYIHKLLHYFTFFEAITDREVQWKYIKLIFKSSNFEPLANLTNTFTNFQHGYFQSNPQWKFNEKYLPFGTSNMDNLQLRNRLLQFKHLSNQHNKTTRHFCQQSDQIYWKQFHKHLTYI